MGGRRAGTVKSCMFSGFKQEHMYVERTVAAFQRLVGLEMLNPRPHGGAGLAMPVSPDPTFPRGEVGAGVALAPESSQVMLCGNPDMVRDTTEALLARGLKNPALATLLWKAIGKHT